MDDNWRPEGWGECPCAGCADISLDNYGLVCDLACGKNTAWLNREDGASRMLEALWKMAEESPTGTFTFDTRDWQSFKNKYSGRWSDKTTRGI